MIVKYCNLCGFPIVRINQTVFGDRCIKCRSTFIHRAMGMVVEQLQIRPDSYIYETSAHGAIFKYLRQRFKHFTYSEYIDRWKPGTLMKGILVQDVQNLTFNSDTFDLVTSTEVFEHVPDDIAGYKEVLRVLVEGGQFVFTVPLSDNEKTIVRAKLIDGVLTHILEPEYHGDHLRNRGILAFRNYGLDIVQLLKSVGFTKVKIHDIELKKHRIHRKQVIVAVK